MFCKSKKELLAALYWGLCLDMFGCGSVQDRVRLLKELQK